MKKKILALALVVVLAVTAVTGATLAYFTDKDAAENVFTTGNVDITLDEVFDPEEAKLLPGIDIQKEVKVTNVGSENAFVRVHIAIPSMLDSGSKDEPQFAAYNNTLHWNFTLASTADGLWNWNADANGAGYPGNGGTWNMYEQEVGGILYNVYVATYETALAKDQQTADNAITKVYLDATVDGVTNADNSVTYKDTKGNTVTLTKDQLNGFGIHIVAEGTQIDTFANAYEALNTAFGVPGTYNPWAPPTT